jgi:hypothetical protein
VPRDVSFIAWATIAFCGLTIMQLTEHLPMLVNEAPLSPGFATSVRIGFAQAVVALIAAGRLLALKPWARLWLVLYALMNLGIFVLWPPSLETLRSVWAGALARGGIYVFLAWTWIPQCALAICTLAVLARPRPEFSSLRRSGRALVLASILLLAAYHGRRFQRGMQLAVESSAAEPHEQFEPKSGEGVVRLTPTINGRPVDDLSAGEVSISLKPYDVRRADGDMGRQGYVNRVFREDLDVDWKVRDGRIELASVPAGHYVLTTAIRRRPGGDLHARSRHTFSTGGDAVDADLPLRVTIRLREPIPMNGEVPRLRSPVKLAWDPVPGNYLYEVLLVSSRPGNKSFSEALETPEWVLDLPSGPWTLEQLDAVGEDGVTIGSVGAQPTFIVEDD